MVEFNTLKSGASADTTSLSFFKGIDEALKEYNESVNLLSNGAQFYKQMHTYLNSLHVFVCDFVQSRNLEKAEIMNQLK